VVVDRAVDQAAVDPAGLAVAEVAVEEEGSGLAICYRRE
jgi:hypothetical protein